MLQKTYSHTIQDCQNHIKQCRLEVKRCQQLQVEVELSKRKFRTNGLEWNLITAFGLRTCNKWAALETQINMIMQNTQNYIIKQNTT